MRLTTQEAAAIAVPPDQKSSLCPPLTYVQIRDDRGRRGTQFPLLLEHRVSEFVIAQASSLKLVAPYPFYASILLHLSA